MKTLIAIFIGGGLGSVLRYCVQLFMHEKIVPYQFPWSTFTVNIIGSFIIGLFYALSAKFSWSSDLRLMLTTGLCGGFTTYSTFSNDIVALLRQGETSLFIIYTTLTLIIGILAVIGGASISKFV